MKKNKELITNIEAAQILGCSVPMVYALKKQGRFGEEYIPKTGFRKFLPRKLVEKLAEEYTVGVRRFPSTAQKRRIYRHGHPGVKMTIWTPVEEIEDYADSIIAANRESKIFQFEAPHEDGYFNRREFAEFYGCTRQWVSVLIKSGIIPSIQIGKYSYIPQDAAFELSDKKDKAKRLNVVW